MRVLVLVPLVALVLAGPVLGQSSAPATAPATAATSAPGATNATASPPPLAVAVGPARTTLFLHLLGYGDDMPVNTQEPQPGYSAEPALGLGTASTSCDGLSQLSGQQGVVGNEHHTFYAYSSPALVEYNFTENGQPRVHPERGLAYDVQLGNTTPVFHWYLTTQAIGQTNPPVPGVNQAPVVVPRVVVKMTLRTGDGISLGDQAYNSGDVLMQGQSAPITFAGPETDQANSDKTGFEGYSVAKDGSPVYAFALPMDVKEPIIPQRTGFNLRIDVYMDNPACNDPQNGGYLMPNVVRPYTDADHRPRLEVLVRNPLRIEYVHPELIGDTWVFHVAAQSPWGTYDVGLPTARIEGPRATYNATLASPPRRFHEDYPSRPPPPAQWTWTWVPGAAPAGAYVFHLQVTNLQHTANATAAAPFTNGDVRPQPGVAAGAGVAVLAGVAFVRRRRA